VKIIFGIYKFNLESVYYVNVTYIIHCTATAVAQNAAGVEEGSREGSVISTIAIGILVIVNLIKCNAHL